MQALVDGEPTSHLPLTDRGFLYGDALFEVLRTYGKRPLFWGAHLRRMAAGGEHLRFGEPCPEKPFRSDVSALGESLGPDLTFRLYWTRGDGAGVVPAEGPTRRIVLASPVVELPEEAYRDGVDCVVVPGTATGAGGGGGKVPSYARNVRATALARAAGAHEALMEDEAGRIEEGATSNLFALYGQRLVTAPETRVLPGVTRGAVLAMAPAAGLDPAFESVDRPRLERADGWFITSSIRGVVPVRSIAGRTPAGEGRLEAAVRIQHLVAAYRQLAAAVDDEPRLGLD